MSLFDTSPVAAPSNKQAPLAERMRPKTIEEYAGQGHLLGEGKPLRLAIERDDATSMIFWGPPGVGKTTLAKIIAQRTQASFIEFSAVMSGIKEIKQVMVEAEKAAQFGSRTILFVDEIHRFNKAQQDAFLPYVETGNDPADRRYDGEPLVRDQRGAAEPMPGVHAGGADGSGGNGAAAKGVAGHGAGAWAAGVESERMMRCLARLRLMPAAMHGRR